MTNITRSRLLAGGLALALGTLAGCGDKTRQHASDGDTGAAAPATKIDMSATSKPGDSTAGVAGPSGHGASAGATDTTQKIASPAAAKP